MPATGPDRKERLRSYGFKTRHSWVYVAFRSNWRTKFETDPAFQYRIHMVFTYVWVVNMVAAVLVFSFAKGFWNHASVLYLVLVSLYANFATDYGAVSAAEAAQLPRRIEGEITVEDRLLKLEGEMKIQREPPK